MRGVTSQGPTPRFDDDPVALDDTLLDQLVDATDGESVPASYGALLDVIATVRGPATENELVGERDAVALFRSFWATGGIGGRSGPARRRRRRATGLFVAGSLSVVTVTGAAAATGRLPDGAQDVAAAVLAKFGISVPDGDGHSPTVSGDAAVASEMDPPVPLSLATLDSLDQRTTNSPWSVPAQPPLPPGTPADTRPDHHPNRRTSTRHPDRTTTRTAGPPPDAPTGPPPDTPTGPPPDTPGPPPDTPTGPAPDTPGPPPDTPPDRPPDTRRTTTGHPDRTTTRHPTGPPPEPQDHHPTPPDHHPNRRTTTRHPPDHHPNRHRTTTRHPDRTATRHPRTTTRHPDRTTTRHPDRTTTRHPDRTDHPDHHPTSPPDHHPNRADPPPSAGDRTPVLPARGGT